MFRELESGQFIPTEALVGQDSLAVPAGVIFTRESLEFHGLTMRGGAGGAGEADRVRKHAGKKYGECLENKSFVESVDDLARLHEKGLYRKNGLDKYIAGLIRFNERLLTEQNTPKDERKLLLKEIVTRMDIDQSAFSSRRWVMADRYRKKHKKARVNPFDRCNNSNLKNSHSKANEKKCKYTMQTVRLLVLHNLIAFPDTLSESAFDFARELWPQHKRGISAIQNRLAKQNRKEQDSGVLIGILADKLGMERYKFMVYLKSKHHSIHQLIALGADTDNVSLYRLPRSIAEEIERKWRESENPTRDLVVLTNDEGVDEGDAPDGEMSFKFDNLKKRKKRRK